MLPNFIKIQLHHGFIQEIFIVSTTTTFEYIFIEGCFWVGDKQNYFTSCFQVAFKEVFPCLLYNSKTFPEPQSRYSKIVYKKTDEWYIESQRVTTSGTTRDNEWQRVVQQVTISASFSFFQIREESNTKHLKENSLNIEEDLWRRPIELRAETSP